MRSPAATGSPPGGPAGSRPARPTTSATREPDSGRADSRRGSACTSGRTTSLLPRGSLGVALERREERVGGDAAFAVNSRDTNAVVGVYRLADGPQAVQLNLRRDDSTQFGARTTGALAYGYGFAPGWRASASLRHRVQGADVQRPLLSGFFQSGAQARDGAQRRACASLCVGRLRRRHRRLPQPGARPDRLRMRRRFQLRAAECRRRDLARRHARHALSPRRDDRDRQRRPAAAAGRRQRTAVAAPRAPACARSPSIIRWDRCSSAPS